MRSNYQAEAWSWCRRASQANRRARAHISRPRSGHRSRDDDGLFIEREEAEPIDNIRVGQVTGPGRIDVVAQHPDLAARRDRRMLVEPAGFGARDRGAAIDLVDQRPAPESATAATRLGVAGDAS